MNEQQFNNKHKIEICQEPWCEYLARISTPGYQSPLICDDDIPFTLQERLQLILNDIDEPLGALIVKALNATPMEISDLTSAVEALPDHTDQFNRALELWEETNRHLGNIEQTLEVIAEKSYPPLPPPPSSQGNRKPRTTDEDESLAVKRLKEAEEVGE